MRPIVTAACCFAALAWLTWVTGDAASADKPAPLPVVKSLELEVACAAALAFSPDGKVLAVAEEDSVTFWDPRTGKPAAKQLRVDDKLYARALAFVDGKTLAVAPDSAPITLYEYPSGKKIITLALGKNQFAVSLVAADGRLVGANHNFVRAWSGPD